MENLWIWILIAVFGGMLINEFLNYLKKSYGIFKIDSSNPEKDIYRIEFNQMDDLSKKKYVVLKIDHNADLSQK